MINFKKNNNSINIPLLVFLNAYIYIFNFVFVINDYNKSMSLQIYKLLFNI